MHQDFKSNSWMIGNRFASDWLYKFGLVCVSIVLIYIYQTGGYVDSSVSSSSELSLRDYNVWIQAGKNLIEGTNPYSVDAILKSGTFSSTLVYMLSVIVPGKSVFFAFMQALNVFGLIYFLKIFFTQRRRQFVLYFLMLTFSSSREILVNGQTTGILVGIFAYVVNSIRLRDIHSRSSNVSHLIGLVLPALGIAFLIDMKPNLTIFPLLALLVYFRNYEVAVAALLLWAIHQIFFSIYVGSSLVLSWYANLNSVTSYELNPTLFGSLGPWQLLTDFNLPNGLMEYGPILTFFIAGILAIKFAIQQRFHYSMLAAFASNYFYSYFHFYSFFPFLAYLTVMVLTGRSVYLAGFFVSSMQFSFNTSTSSVEIASIAILIIFLSLFKFNSIKSSLIFGLGWVTYLLFKNSVFFMVGTDELLAKSIIIATAVTLSMLVGGVKDLQSNSSGTEENS